MRSKIGWPKPSRAFRLGWLGRGETEVHTGAMAKKAVSKNQESPPTRAKAITERYGARPRLPWDESPAATSLETEVSVRLIRDLDQSSLYINRELSLLEFQRRVLDEARDTKNPLLERAKFLGIVGSNLDEFFMVRVAGLREQVAAGVLDVPADGLTPEEQLIQIRRRASRLLSDSRKCFYQDLLPELANEGIRILDYQELKPKQKSNLKDYFEEVIFPILTPLAHDPGRPFPFISNLSLNLALVIRDKEGGTHFARVKVPGTIPRLIRLSSTKPLKSVRGSKTISFTWIEQVIAAHLDALFPGMEVVESHPFRVTRSADMEIQELEAGDLLETMKATVRRRQFGRVVRVTVNRGMPRHVREILMKNLELEKQDFYVGDGPLGLSSLMALSQIERRELRFPAFSPRQLGSRAQSTEEDGIFAEIKKNDILIFHPFDSFVPVVEFLKQAARDPQVLAIKQTLYRVGSDSPVVDALLEARENGKQVAVMLELKARFDEESNINWARALEREGVHVVYGLPGLKTHCKVALVVRQEQDGIRRYVHLATGNYNAVTAQLYTDIGMFTCDPAIGADATDLFNYLTGYSAKRRFRRLLVAPINLREELSALVEREIRQQKDAPAHLIFKMNSLVDQEMIKLLYRASQCGVKVDLLVRGICCLRPGIPGLSENIRVISLVGRFLEHGRIYYFRNGGNPEIFIGSADLMPRNINSRVEALMPVSSPELISELCEILEIQLEDDVNSMQLKADGSYARIQPSTSKPLDSHQYFLERASSGEILSS